MVWLVRGAFGFTGLAACLLPVLMGVGLADSTGKWDGSRWAHWIGNAILVLLAISVSCAALWVSVVLWTWTP